MRDVSENEVAHFRANGWVTLRRFLSPAASGDLRDRLESSMGRASIAHTAARNGAPRCEVQAAAFEKYERPTRWRWASCASYPARTRWVRWAGFPASTLYTGAPSRFADGLGLVVNHRFDHPGFAVTGPPDASG